MPPDSPSLPLSVIVAAIVAGSALLIAGLGLFTMPDPPTDQQIASAQTYLDGVCPSCPVYEILEPAAMAADDTNYPPLSQTRP